MCGCAGIVGDVMARVGRWRAGRMVAVPARAPGSPEGRTVDGSREGRTVDGSPEGRTVDGSRAGRTVAGRARRAAVAAVLGLVATLAGGLVPAGVPGAPPSARAGPSVRDQSWYLAEMGIPTAQQYSRGAGVTVAVIDAGVDATGADLAGQVLPGVELDRDERDGAVIVGPGDGRIDPDGHGTGMAGLIAARGDTPDRLIGVAPEAK